MIVRVDYDLGIQVEATAPEPDGIMTYEEVAAGLLVVCPGVHGVQLWKGETVTSIPSAIAIRSDPESDDEPVNKYLADAHADFVYDLACMLDLDSGLARIIHGQPNWDQEWRERRGFPSV